MGDRSLANIVFSNGTIIDGASEFLITYSLSIISASLGLAKCLKNGVARPIGAGGCLDGLLSARHLLAFFASGFSLGARGFCLGVAMASASTQVIDELQIVVLFLSIETSAL